MDGEDVQEQRPEIAAPHSEGGSGVHAKMPNCDRRGVLAAPGLSQQVPRPKAAGQGINAAAEPSLSQQIPLIGDPPRGVDAAGRVEARQGLAAKVPADKRPLTGVHRRPQLSGDNPGSRGKGVHAQGRPQLADAYARGRGVHGNDAAGTCAQRRAWLVEWFGRLRDRLRTVRVCCGDWLRVCDSPSVTTRLGVTGIFFDAPYRLQTTDGRKNRAGDLYANDRSQDVNRLVDDVIAYCRERGADPRVRIAACCLEGEGYEALLGHGWECVAWKSKGGYGNQSGANANRHRERIFFSPHCIKSDLPLFGV